MNIIVNGGTRGIGKEIVLYLSQHEDNQLIVTGRNSSTLEDLSNQHRNIQTVALDLSDFDLYAGKFLSVVSSNFRKVDIVINCAGLLIPGEFMEITNAEARMMMETNFFGPASMIRILKPFLSEGSHIVNIASMGGFQGSSKYKGLSYYSASKAALACLTECLATEFNESGIKVNCLALGAVQTEMFEEAFPGFEAPVKASDMGEYISEFALKGHRFFNGKILPVSISNP